ncbi:SIR2 family NAD-dependent protein deacylase [Kutzneria sp. CA-103260]|uniref:SIR2 family NAD-dependent protein deacylase n=1 Tax=Kutzneria sp. CA-103260 TaxID=2802641 RepID=UPI001BA6A5EA|nr:Sir2 family NAD-dependent protein deacetylase [Kutzneria sp. CA-103260]QUQ71035.1 SIR2 family NAD-dependent deacetylase [Kutzneria sp. CA-103260]
MTRIAVLTGAGISTDSGIPDYRGPQGEWTKDPRAQELFTYQNFMGDERTRGEFWRRYEGHPAWRAEPNEAHRAIAKLANVRVLTQNVDGLHQKAGTPERKVLELHGSMHRTVCVQCESRHSTEEILDGDKKCPSCKGILKLGVTLLGEHLDPEVIGHARNIAAASEVFLAVGSSLQVEPAAALCAVAVRAGARLVIVNRDPTPYDDMAAEKITEPIGTAVPRLCEELAQ